MKKVDFIKVIQDIPTFAPIFEVIKVPHWASQYISEGDELLYNTRNNSFQTMDGTSKNLALTSTYVKFVEYRHSMEYRQL